MKYIFHDGKRVSALHHVLVSNNSSAKKNYLDCNIILNENAGIMQVFQVTLLRLMSPIVKSYLRHYQGTNVHTQHWQCDSILEATCPNTNNKMHIHIEQGPVVQSIVSLTSSLRGQLLNCFMTL